MMWKLSVAAMALLAGFSSELQAGVILDQQNLTGQYLGGPALSNVWAQTFTVGVDGILDSIDLQLTRWFGTAANSSVVSFELRGTTTGGAPTGAPIYSTSFLYADVPSVSLSSTTIPLVSVDVSSAAINVSQGDILAITVKHSDLIWMTNDNGPAYAAGAPYQFVAGSWTASGLKDLGFQTHVNATSQAVPEPCSLVLIGIGVCVAGAGTVRRRRQISI